MSEFAIDQNLIFLILKFAFLSIAIFYFIFSFVMERQIKVMKKTFVTNFNSVISLLGLTNLLLAALMIFLSLIF